MVENERFKPNPYNTVVLDLVSVVLSVNMLIFDLIKKMGA